MLITINGPYRWYNQIVATKVREELKELYPDMKVFSYLDTPTSELDNALPYESHEYNPFLHIAKILSQMASDIKDESKPSDGFNRPFDGCIRDYINSDEKLVIATEWYSSAIIRVLSNLIPYDSMTNLAEILSTKDKLVDFAFNLVKEFQLASPDLNIVYVPNKIELEDDMTHRITCTRSLSKNEARQIKECYANYMNLLTSDSRNLFTKNGENYVPVYVMNRSDIIISNTNSPINAITKTTTEIYQNFHKKMLRHQWEHTKTQTEVAKDIINIIKTFIDIVHPNDETN